MPFGEALKLALQSLWANKMRTVLTLLGVVIGVASVISPSDAFLGSFVLIPRSQ